MKATMMKTAAMVLGLGLLAGCASTDQLTKMEADVASAQAAADSAMQAAKQHPVEALRG